MRADKQQIPKYIIEHDLNKSAYHGAGGQVPEIVPDFSGRVGFRFPADNLYFELTERWNNNEPIPCLDFANEIRKLRARMLAAKTVNGQENTNNGKYR
jgi:hypothetical protein